MRENERYAMYIVVFTSKTPSVAYTRERTVRSPPAFVFARIAVSGFSLFGADIWLGGLIRDNISAGCRCAQTSMRRQGALRDLCLGSGFTFARRICGRGCLSCANRFGSSSPCSIFCAADIISYACVCLLGDLSLKIFS